MVYTCIISLLVIICLICFIVFKPSLKIGSLSIETYFIAPLVGALLLIIFKAISIDQIISSFTSSSNVNPLKILILFISLSMISITLDELGFFHFLAFKALSKVNKNQYSLFFILYVLIGLLTIFTSNDIVILTFTPFICYFSKKAKINPLPYLIMEFVNANTYSILFSIGNPTNIYLSQYFNITFIDYVKVMYLPTIFSGITSLLVMLFLFRKQLNNPICNVKLESKVNIDHKIITYISLLHLIVTTILLVISNYINIEMWLICLLSASSLTIFLIAFSLFNKSFKELKNVFKRLPYLLIPFVLSMFIIVMALENNQVNKLIGEFILKLSKNNDYLSSFIFLLSSIISDNLINNIPMSVLYASFLNQEGLNSIINICSTIIGSNIGAYLTPVGALAGIMWMNLLKKQEIKFNFIDFIKYGIIIVPFVFLASYCGLIISCIIF